MSEWKPGEAVPERYAGMPVTFEWNSTALTTMLRVLREHYPSGGYPAMCAAVRQAMRDFTPPTPPKPEEPQGLGAVVEDDKGEKWVRVYGRASSSDYECWKREHHVTRHCWSEVAAVRVLSEGVRP